MENRYKIVFSKKQRQLLEAVQDNARTIDGLIEELERHSTLSKAKMERLGELREEIADNINKTLPHAVMEGLAGQSFESEDIGFIASPDLDKAVIKSIVN